VTAVREVLRFADGDTLADLVTYVGRALRVDPDGVVRLVGHGDVLAVYVSPVHGGGGPVVLGLRTLRLAVASGVDATVPVAALTERFGPPSDNGDPLLAVPPAEAPRVAWVGTSPPRRGWEAVAAVAADVLTARVLEGVTEVAAGVPPGAGAAAVASLRARVWGRQLDTGDPATAGLTAGLPAGVAYAADALGFLDAEPAAVYRCGPWWRLTTGRGHVLARRPALPG
jgi:hypothetical protein